MRWAFGKTYRACRMCVRILGLGYGVQKSCTHQPTGDELIQTNG